MSHLTVDFWYRGCEKNVENFMKCEISEQKVHFYSQTFITRREKLSYGGG